MRQTKPEWVDKAVTIHNFHVMRLKSRNHWKLADTAKDLGRSIGYISQYLKAAQWLRSHKDELMRIESFEEAIEFIKEKEFESITIELDL